MSLRFLAAITASLLVGAGCREITPTAPKPPTPPSSITVGPSPLTAQQKADSLKVALIAYNGVRPLDRYTGKPAPVINTKILGGEKDTIYFNGERWSHRAELQRVVRFLVRGDAPEGTTEKTILNVTYAYANPGNKDDNEVFSIMIPNAIGRYRNAELIQPYLGTAYFLAGSDYVVDYYTLNPAMDNWVEVTSIDHAQKLVKGRFSLYFYLAPPTLKRSPIYSPIVLPSNIHMTGSIN